MIPGLALMHLNGEPGVYTADWAGPSRDWMMAMRTVEEKLQAAGATTNTQAQGIVQLHAVGAVAGWRGTDLCRQGPGSSDLAASRCLWSWL